MSKAERTGIFVTIRFWTDTTESGKIVPRKAYAAGTISVQASKMHRIKSMKAVMFDRLEEIVTQLDKALRASGITLVTEDLQSGVQYPRLGKGYAPKRAWA